VGPQILSIVSLLSIDSVFFTPPSKRQLVEQVKQRFASLEGVCSPGADVASPDPVAEVAAASPVLAQMWQRVRWLGRHLAEAALASSSASTVGARAGDHLSLLNVWRQYKEAKGARAWCMDHFINTRSMKLAIEVREQLVGYCTAMKLVITSCGRNLENVLRCLVCGLFMQAARLQPDGRTYRTLVSNQEVYIHPSSVLLDKKRPAVIYTELVMTSKQYIRTLTAIDTAWLAELAPQMYSRQS
jgi:HrpA-like RNA helicase